MRNACMYVVILVLKQPPLHHGKETKRKLQLTKLEIPSNPVILCSIGMPSLDC